MKTISLKTFGAVLASAFLGGHLLLAQEAVTTTTTTNSAGTISEFSPQEITVRTDSTEQPVHYTYTKSTTYVDESGNPVSMETVKSGLPVTVYYEKSGDDLVASKVVVRRAVNETVPATVDVTKTTTTTTTTK